VPSPASIRTASPHSGARRRPIEHAADRSRHGQIEHPVVGRDQRAGAVGGHHHRARLRWQDRGHLERGAVIQERHTVSSAMATTWAPAAATSRRRARQRRAHAEPSARALP
jgi:hypothetical protein